MSDLIKREDAIMTVGEWTHSNEWGDDKEPPFKLVDMLAQIPSADRPQGEWIEQHENGHGFWVGRCSRCSAVSRVTEYCPDCGAKMERSRR